MKRSMRVLLLLALAGAGLFAGTRAGAEGDQTTTFCVDRPISFDPMFRPSGCFTYKPIAGGVVVIGHALLDFQYLTYGRAVEARVNGQTCGRTTIPGVDGVFVLPIAGGDSQPGCATAGQRLDFYIYDVQADQTLAWPATPGADPEFLPLTAVNNVSWFWFERASTPAPRVGTTVQALTSGALCSETTIGGEDEAIGTVNRPNIRGFSRLVVPSASVQPGCAQNSSLVEFTVGGLRAETALLWRPGVQRIDVLVQGDANCDFLVDPRDATLALQKYAALLASVPCHGDADRDGDIDVFDARHILEFAAGITNGLPL